MRGGDGGGKVRDSAGYGSRDCGGWWGKGSC